MGSQIIEQSKNHIKDPYSLRCITQVHGHFKDMFEYSKKIFEKENNPVTGNPNVFTESDQIISGGNFNGQPLALNIIAIALSVVRSISERSAYQSILRTRNLLVFLVDNPWLNSGLIIP